MDKIIHVIKIPTTNNDLFPYCHYADQGHDPVVESVYKEDYMLLVVRDLFKMKPNYQNSPRNRADIYIPMSTALKIGEEIVERFGSGEIAELNEVNPEQFRRGPQTLPLIQEARQINYERAEFEIAGFKVSGINDRVYIDNELPAEGHIEMAGQEIHLGIRLDRVEGSLNKKMVMKRSIPEGETKVPNEPNPLNKSIGCFSLKLDAENARNLASTFIYYCQRDLN